MRIRWTKAASQDLDDIEEYIREYNPKAAIKQVLRVIDAVETKLSNSPGMGKPGRIPEFTAKHSAIFFQADFCQL